MGPQNSRRPSDKHLSEEEFNALVPSLLGGNSCLSADAARAATHHLAGCEDCTRTVSIYRQLSTQPLPGRATPPRADCPKEEDVDWYEIAAGLWPEFKTKQLLLHAAQ